MPRKVFHKNATCKFREKSDNKIFHIPDVLYIKNCGS